MDLTWYQNTVEAGETSVTVWGVYSWRDMGPLIYLETTLTGDGYVSILCNHLDSFMPIVHFDGIAHFKQNNATPHTSTSIVHLNYQT